MYQYKNTSDRDRTLINIGVVKAGETITVNTPIHNKHFQRVQGDATPQPEQPASVVGIEQPQPQSVTEVHHVEVNQVQGDQ